MPLAITRGAAAASSFGFTSQFVQAPPGQATYATPGTYSWVCPKGVTAISVVCVGGGGGGVGSVNAGGGAGGGGAQAYTNNLAVVPGQSYTITVGAGGTRAGIRGTATEGGN